MEGLVKGDIVIVLFPFSDIQNAKRRPAAVIANQKSEDILLAQITSKPYTQPCHQLPELPELKHTSYVRYNKLFSAHQTIISKKITTIPTKHMSKITEKLIQLLRE